MQSVHNNENACDGVGQVEGLNLRRLLQNRIIVVPINQRPFAWEHKELSELWNDIDSLQGRGYFMSSMVIKPCSFQLDNSYQDEFSESQSASMYMTRSAGIFKPHLLIDGQQRLISLSLLIRCICEHLDDKKIVERVKQEYLFFEPVGIEQINGGGGDNSSEIPRLRLHKDLNATFENILSFEQSRNIVFGDSRKRNLSISAQERLLKCAEFFNAKLLRQQSKNIDESWFQQYLYDLLVTIGEKLFFSVITASPDANVGVLFEGGNCRGRGLTILENIKNKLAQICQDTGDRSLTDYVDSTWSTIHTHLMRANLCSAEDENKFLHSFWQSTRSHIVPPENRIYTEISEYFDATKLSQERLLPRVIKFLDEIRPAVKVFCYLHVSQREKAVAVAQCFPEVRSEKIRTSLIRGCRDLHDLCAMDTFIPLLMRAHTCQTIVFLQVLASCEKYAMLVFRVSGKKSNTGKKELCKIAGGLYICCSPEIFPVVNSIEQLTSKHANQDCLEKLIHGTLDFTQWKYTRYFLQKCERYLRYCNAEQEQKCSPFDRPFRELLCDASEIDSSQLTLEHILPQTSGNHPYWRSQFGDECALYLHRIGNLSLAKRSDNASYGCRSYNEKSLYGNPCYNTSNILLERQISQTYSEWGPRELLLREGQLLEWAEDIWPLTREK